MPTPKQLDPTKAEQVKILSNYSPLAKTDRVNINKLYIIEPYVSPNAQKQFQQIQEMGFGVVGLPCGRFPLLGPRNQWPRGERNGDGRAAGERSCREGAMFWILSLFGLHAPPDRGVSQHGYSDGFYRHTSNGGKWE